MVPCYNTTEPSVGLKMNKERTTMKCFMADTGLLISHTFDENGIMREEIYKKIMLDKLAVNFGNIMENIVAQMLTANGHALYFYTNSSREDASSRMEIDFLVSKTTVTNKHNIFPLEIKTGKNYTLSSLRKFIRKFPDQLCEPFVFPARWFAAVGSQHRRCPCRNDSGRYDTSHQLRLGCVHHTAFAEKGSRKRDVLH